MATANLTLELVGYSGSSWGITNGYKCYRMALPNSLNKLRIDSLIFSLRKTSSYDDDDVTTYIWVEDHEIGSRPSREPDCSQVINTKKANTVFEWEIANGVNALDGSTVIFYVYMELSGSAGKCTFNSGYKSNSVIFYSDVIRFYDPKITFNSQPDRVPSKPTSIFSQTLNVTVFNNPPAIETETYSSGCIFRVYSKGEILAQDLVSVRSNSADDLTDGISVSKTFSSILYSKGSSYSFTAEYIVYWDESGDYETSGEVQLSSYSVEAIPFTIAKNNMGVGIGRFCETRTDPDEGLFECGWKAKFYEGIFDANGNPITGGINYELGEAEIGMFCGEKLYRYVQRVSNLDDLVRPNFKELISIYGTATSSNGYTFPVNMYYDGSHYLLIYPNDAGGFTKKVNWSSTSRTLVSAVLIMEYTKN